MTPTFTLTAQNAAGDTTNNYHLNFARLNLATQLGLAAINDPAAWLTAHTVSRLRRHA
ncbi:hypothetical protein LP419_01260 [Massilia sp. H-1]|nr:hypothetical protein LP419_01260 [Massilia sp. H-1]